MKPRKHKLKIGIVGCGAIGSRIAESIKNDLKSECRLTGLLDICHDKAHQLAKRLSLKKITKSSLKQLIKDCELMVEAVSAKNTRAIIHQALKARKNVLAMSVGKLLNAQALFTLAKANKCTLLLPSGALAGIDAIKAASLIDVRKIILTTRKPPAGFIDNPYFIKKGFDLKKIKKETVLFKGDVDTAVKLFPQNINVAATLALACQNKKKITIQIFTSPKYKTNSHEVEMIGDFGHMRTRTDNVVCPDNPKTSYLAVLSGLQTLRQFCSGVLIGT
jgi:aspartate dehydrogenase